MALIHGDGQYAPECLPRLMSPLASGAADAVFGSRMMEPGAARRGGMPLYKHVGNRVRLGGWVHRRRDLGGLVFIDLRDRAGIVHVPVGRASFTPEQLAANVATLVDAVNRAKPSGAKGTYMRTLTLAPTMGPGVRVDIPSALAAANA